MAKHQRFWQKDYFAHLGATIMFVCSFISLAFVTVGTPLAMYIYKHQIEGLKPCSTLWGFKYHCGGAAYDGRANLDQCQPRRVRFQTAEAFACLSIFSILLQLYLSYEQLSGHMYKIAIIGVAVLSLASTTVVWAVVAAIHNNSYCGENIYSSQYTNYGPGFALFIVAFAVQIIGLIAFIAAEPSQWVKKQADPYV